MSADLNTLSLADLMRLKAKGRLDIHELVAACDRRVRARESEVRAFEYYDFGAVENQIKALGPDTLPLHGIPFGVKDIIDTRDMPTTWGSTIYADHYPARDAGIVATLRAAGGIVFGKTVTTEFAFLDPGKTRNPINLKHTPGGSSQGSAASVADAMVPFALGTQTAASVIRPAAFCGIVGYKASVGEFDLGGVGNLSQTMDSLGFFTRDAEDLVILRQALLGSPSDDAIPERKKWKIGFVKTAHWQLADEAYRELIEKVGEALATDGHEWQVMTIGPDSTDLADAQVTVMAYEAARARMPEYRDRAAELSPNIKALIEQGLSIPLSRYQSARRLALKVREELKRALLEHDFLMTPSTTGEAPATLEQTGDPIFSRMWTVMGAPAITLPVGRGPAGLPLGIQLISAVGEDGALVQHAVGFQKYLRSRG